MLLFHYFEFADVNTGGTHDTLCANNYHFNINKI